MHPHVQPRQGFALATAIVMIVVIGALIAGAFYGSTNEFRTGRNALYQERALTAAEFGQAEVLKDWIVDSAIAMKYGDVRTRTTTVESGATASVRVTRLNHLTWLAVSEGRVAAGTDMQSRRRTGLLIRHEVPNVRMLGALTTDNRTDIAGSGSLSGADANPTGWQCDPAGATRPGVVNDNAADVVSGGTCSGFTCVSGSPQVKVDPEAADPTTYDEFGGFDYDSLATLANIVLNLTSKLTLNTIVPAYDASGACVKTNMKNWGEPVRNSPATTCETYFPIVHAKGPALLELSNGRGQGILLVDGNLAINGQFEWFGPIIVKGTVKIDGLGNKVIGGVMAKGEGCTIGGPVKFCNYVAGTAHIQFSRCALLSTMMSRATPVVATRAWADLF